MRKGRKPVNAGKKAKVVYHPEHPQNGEGYAVMIWDGGRKVWELNAYFALDTGDEKEARNRICRKIIEMATSLARTGYEVQYITAEKDRPDGAS